MEERLFLALSSAVLFASDDAPLLDAGCLTCELAQIVQLSATHLTVLVDLDVIDSWRLSGEDTLYTHGTRHLAHGETLLVTMTANLDYDATVELDTLL
jgi:hypothetical protein